MIESRKHDVIGLLSLSVDVHGFFGRCWLTCKQKYCPRCRSSEQRIYLFIYFLMRICTLMRVYWACKRAHWLVTLLALYRTDKCPSRLNQCVMHCRSQVTLPDCTVYQTRCYGLWFPQIMQMSVLPVVDAFSSPLPPFLCTRSKNDWVSDLVSLQS